MLKNICNDFCQQNSVCSCFYFLKILNKYIFLIISIKWTQQARIKNARPKKIVVMITDYQLQPSTPDMFFSKYLLCCEAVHLPSSSVAKFLLTSHFQDQGLSEDFYLLINIWFCYSLTYFTKNSRLLFAFLYAAFSIQ